jgi:hypothetical protein
LVGVKWSKPLDEHERHQTKVGRGVTIVCFVDCYRVFIN